MPRPDRKESDILTRNRESSLHPSAPGSRRVFCYPPGINAWGAGNARECSEGLSHPRRITRHLMKTFCFLLTTLIGLSALAGSRAAENPAALIPRYEKISAALVADDFTTARAAARQLAAEAGNLHRAGIAAAAQAVAQADDLSAARAAFKNLSNETIALARRQKGYFIMTCPMAQADWVQSARAVANPYLGQAMPTCGTMKEETKG